MYVQHAYLVKEYVLISTYLDQPVVIFTYVYVQILINKKYLYIFIGHGVIVCSHSYNTETELHAVRQVLEQPNMQMAPGKHYAFSVGQLG
jgi:hypothetical protein